MTTNKDLKTTRTAAKITRGQLAQAAGISQFAIDKHERGVDVKDEIVKAYDTAMAKLVAEAAETQPAAKATPAKKAAAKKTTAKAVQPKPKAEDPAA